VKTNIRAGVHIVAKSTWLLVTVVALTMLIIRYTLKAPKAPGRQSFGLACVFALWWTACVLFRHSVQDYQLKLLSCELAWFGIIGAPLYWCLSLITYSNGRQLEKRWQLLLAGGTACVFGLIALTNDWHHWIYLYLIDESSMSFARGWGFYVGITIVYVMMALTCIVGLLRSVHAKGIHRLQIWILLVSATLPWIGNAGYVFLNLQLFDDDPTPFIFAATGCFILVTQLFYELFILPPIGRDAIFAVLPDPVVVLDQQGRILELNPAAAQLPGIPKHPIGKILESPQELAQLLSSEWPSDEDRVEVRFGINDKAYELSCQSLAPWGRAGARMVTLRDITSRKSDELRLAALSKSLHDRLEENLILQTRLKEEASRDHLTGLHNRRHAHALLPALLENGENDAQTAVFLIDIDHFKQFNDRYGHQTGDKVLTVFARLLQSDLQSGEYAFRWGGEEFLVVLPLTDLSAALARSRRWRDAFAQRALSSLIDLQPTFSAGLHMCGPGTTNIQTAIKAADTALYKAKTAGRNQTALSDAYAPHEGQ
jgi:diguanylate cyclase (GGDEF)-like protein